MALEYDLIVRQQPKAARMCGLGSKVDRRPIDPPPIVQLHVSEYPQDAAPGQSPIPTSTFLQNPYFFMFAALVSPDSDDELQLLKDGRTRYTAGSVVSSLYHLKDTENGGVDAGFFVFPDLSVRSEGSYRLKFSLFEVKGIAVHHCRSVFSNPFYVYRAKKFPGMEESTPLSCSLADQGLKIRIRKDTRVRRKSLAVPDAKHTGEDDEDNDAQVSSSSATNAGTGPPSEDTRPSKRRETERDKGKGKVAKPMKRPRLVDSDAASQQKESESSPPCDSGTPRGTLRDQSCTSNANAPCASSMTATQGMIESAPRLPETTNQSQRPRQEVSSVPRASRLESTALVEPVPQRTHVAEDGFRPNAAPQSEAHLDSDLQPTQLPPPHHRPVPRPAHTMPPPPPPLVTSLSPSPRLAATSTPHGVPRIPTCATYPNSYYSSSDPIDSWQPSYSYVASGYPAADFQSPDSLSSSEHTPVAPQDLATDVVLLRSSNAMNQSNGVPSGTPVYEETILSPYSCASNPRHDPMISPSVSVPPPHHAGEPSFPYSTHVSSAGRREQPSLPAPLQSLPQPAPGYPYQSSPYEALTLQYHGGNMSEREAMHAPAHLEPCDYNTVSGGYNRFPPLDNKPVSSGSDNYVHGRRGNAGVILPPSRATTGLDRTRQCGAPLPVVDTHARYLPQALETHYYAPHPTPPPRECHASEATLHYRAGNNQGMESTSASAFYPSSVALHPHHHTQHVHPTYGRRVADLDIHTTSSALSSGGSNEGTLRPPIILPPPSQVIGPAGRRVF